MHPLVELNLWRQDREPHLPAMVLNLKRVHEQYQNEERFEPTKDGSEEFDKFVHHDTFWPSFR